MAQIFFDGKPICRWCKQPLTKKELAGAARPREVHEQHVRLRRNARNSGKWTEAMDEALTADEVAELKLIQQRKLPSWDDCADDLQSILNQCLAAGTSPSRVLVNQLMVASASLLESIRVASRASDADIAQ